MGKKLTIQSPSIVATSKGIVSAGSNAKGGINMYENS